MKKLILKSNLSLIICALFLISCGNSGKKQNGNKEDVPIVVEFPIKLDYNADYPVKDFDLEKIADIEYIALKGDDVLLSGYAGERGISISDSNIVMSSGDEIFIFDRKGEFINKFKRKGRGRGEYQHLISLTADHKNKEVFISDYALKYKIYVYSFDGKFKRSFNIPNELWMETMFDYNDEYLLAHLSYSPDSKNTDNIFYYFITKSDGEFIPVGITPKEFVSDMAAAVGDRLHLRYGLSARPIIKNGSEILLSDYGRDTIYIGSGDSELTPFLVKFPKFVDSEEPTFVYPLFKTTKYTFLRRATRKNPYKGLTIDQNLLETKENGRVSLKKGIGKKTDAKIRHFAIDNTTGEIFEANITHSDRSEAGRDFLKNFKMNRVNLPSNHLVFTNNTIDYIEANERGELSGGLKEFVSTLSEDDNNFLMIIKFKD